MGPRDRVLPDAHGSPSPFLDHFLIADAAGVWPKVSANMVRGRQSP